MSLTTETLFDFKMYFDSQLEATVSAIMENDSERLIKNKINGFLIAIQDKLFQIKPKLQCNGCGKIGNTNSAVATPMSNRITAEVGYMRD